MDALIVEDGEAAGLARELAERQGTTVRRAVISSLRASLDTLPPQNAVRPKPLPLPALEALTPEQRADYDALRTLAEMAKTHTMPGATSDRSEMYDQDGLPI